MAANCKALKACLLAVALMVGGHRALAQFAVDQQAESPEEFDAYLKVLAQRQPKDVISASLAFEKAWPASGLSGHVAELEMEAYRQLDDAAAAIRAGERALRAAPGNLSVLAQLAYVYANAGADPQHLSRARELAEAEIEAANKIRLPKSISPERWEEIRGRLGGLALSALGMVAYKGGDLVEATNKFEEALHLNHGADPALHYRLGVVYKARGMGGRAVEELRKAADSNDPVVAPLAQGQLTELRQGQSKP